MLCLVLVAHGGIAVAQTAPETSEKSTREERTKKRKDTLKISLNPTKTAQLKDKCKAAQGKLQSVSKRIDGVRTSRNETYNNLTSRLTKTTEKLEANNIDVTELKTSTNKLSEKIVAYKSIMTDYQIAIDDAAALDCQSDPVAFLAAITEARNSVDKIKQSNQEIKSLLKDTIKPILVEIRSELTKPNKESEQ